MEGKIVIYASTDRNTSGTRRFKEETENGERGAIGTIYVTKAAAEANLGTMPDRIKVTVESA